MQEPCHSEVHLDITQCPTSSRADNDHRIHELSGQTTLLSQSELTVVIHDTLEVVVASDIACTMGQWWTEECL